MHLPTEKLRDAAVDVALDTVDAGRSHAEDLVSSGADRVAAAIDHGTRRRRRLRVGIRLVLAVAAVVGLVALVARRRNRSPANDAEPAHFDVVPAEGGGWDVVGPHEGEVASHHDTQALGVEHASELAARGGGGAVVIHGLDGTPRDTRTIAAAGAS